MDEDTRQKRIVSYGGVSIFIGFIWLVFIYNPSNISWSGNGTVSVFPKKGESKNYRLEAEIDAKRRLNSPITYTADYTVRKIYWPNGGYLIMESCVVPDKEMVSCTDKNGNSYYVEIDEKPTLDYEPYTD